MGVLAAIMGLVVLLQIGAGLWLALLGQWSVIGYGVALLFLGALALGVLQMPGAKLVDMAEVRGNRRMAGFLMIASTVWGSLCMAFWCELSVERYVPLAHGSAMLPVLIWGNGVALLPLHAVAIANRGTWIAAAQAYACLPLYAVSAAAALGYLGQSLHMLAQAVAVFAAPAAVCLVLAREV